ncbi:binding-protein-dependent transport systems inner membrane component [Paenibacillus vortex V453]|jgi:raffinose/stachyose/melibiose transport system permease protein|uniref:Sugar ABC transporter permease n=2 Tax=Paenibacillus TaxID=44249 RepID=A0A163LB21_9BACL|nr:MULTISPECIES: carbohydrate ABC transporter permease [Paenibacillus]ANA81917.1 sugar ABC transporter permease [Paenibacillus glucanolyticus]AVV59350.1 carbohydrate ABC transporter permease [Paenibacillus glucanolyticus]AWP28532.1 sugar ABC transporter permease [Paenibacillus sp. Cedars]EFU41808.1 binding-protein-dependent transport systems inner membrane component [Paenibacillus vortex V453]ETT43342.1 binding-protein-dependent transport systems inner membrane component [Paenibacillus sp. FSL
MRALKKLIPHIFLMAYLLIILYPFLFVLFSSVKVDNQSIASNPFGLPSTFVFDNYVNAWVNAKISTYFWNSLYIGVLSACLSILFAAMLAFAVTRMRYNRISAIVFQCILIGMLIPNNSLMLPIYGMMRQLDILNTHMALILPYVANAIPFSVIILAAFMRSLPGEIEEAAVIDGLRSGGLFARIILPLTVPAIVTVFIINFLGNWNEFLLANYFLSNDELRTLPVGMVGFRDAYNMNYAQMSAGIVFSVLPVLIIYAVLQEKIIEGVTAGSVKG